MPSFVNKILLSLLLVLSSTITHAMLITNGSFEQTTFDDNSISMGSIFNSMITRSYT